MIIILVILCILGPYWDDESVRVTPKMYLKSVLDKELSEEDKKKYQTESGDDYSKEIYDKYNTRVHRLKYYLKHTMGCVKTFEFRRRELAELKGMCLSTFMNRLNITHLTSGVQITDISEEEVLNNFVDSVEKEDGFVRRYLDAAELGAVIGNTLFVHGAIDELSMGFIPSPKNRDRVQEVIEGEEWKDTHSLQEWLAALNKWGRESFQEWKDNMKWNHDRSWRGGEAVIGNRLLI